MIDINNREDLVEFDARFLNINESEYPNLFITHASGNGMINAGVQDKDILICLRTENVRSGDLVVVNANGESMLRRFIQEGKSARFKKENGTGEEILVKEYTILGKLVAIQRNM